MPTATAKEKKLTASWNAFLARFIGRYHSAGTNYGFGFFWNSRISLIVSLGTSTPATIQPFLITSSLLWNPFQRTENTAVGNDHAGTMVNACGGVIAADGGILGTLKGSQSKELVIENGWPHRR